MLLGGIMLVDAKDILKESKVIQFNINNLEWTKWILEECNYLHKNVILGVSSKAINYMGGPNTVFLLVEGLMKDLNIDIKVCLHLDHGKDVNLCKKCIDAGFTSVMFDGSSLSMDDNIKCTREVKEYASLFNVTVEGEVGVIGGALPDALAVNNFVLKTNVDMIAFAMGTVHGYGHMDINWTLLDNVKKNNSVPLVLHGGSGISNDTLKLLINHGIDKININTDLQFVFSKAIRRFLNMNSDVYDPRVILGSGELALKNEVKNKLDVLDGRCLD